MGNMGHTGGGLVYVGIRGTVVALDRATGAEAWRTPLKGYGFVNVVDGGGGDLLAATRGEVFCLDVFCLDPVDGRIRWANPMRGLGYGLACFAAPVTAGRGTSGNSPAAVAQYLADHNAEASAG